MTGADGDPNADLWLIGRDYGANEAREGKPFVGKAGDLLNKMLTRAGLRRENVFIDNVIRKQPPGNLWTAHTPSDLLAEPCRLKQQIREYQPKLVVAFGNEAFRVVMDEHPNYGDVPSITEARGYLFDSPLGCRVLPIVHPAATLREWVPWRVLTEWDLRKAKREVELGCPPFPERRTIIVTEPAELQELRNALRVVEWAAYDIENFEDLQLACLGVAVTQETAYVIPSGEPWMQTAIRELCQDATPKIWQNGMYDRYFLRQFCDITVENTVHDTMLGWHALMPELSGMKDDPAKRKKMRRKTQKSLRFLASIYCRVPWWKSYDFEQEVERYELNGLDCMITLEIANRQKEQLR